MKHARLTMASVAGAIALSGAAMADFTGLAATSRTHLIQPDDWISGDVFEIYATFDGPDHWVTSVMGTPANAQTLATPGGFFQATIFGAHQNGPNADGLAQIPGLWEDSLLTIGVRQRFAGVPTLATLEGFNVNHFNGPGGTGFGNPIVVTTDGGWFVEPYAPISAATPYPPSLPNGETFTFPPGATHGVILAQLTVHEGESLAVDLGELTFYHGDIEHVLTGPEVELTISRATIACPGDLDGSGNIDFGDILRVIAAWGPCGPVCPEDLQPNGNVDFGDILAVIGAWGPCPE
jgi:hypothetical protein